MSTDDLDPGIRNTVHLLQGAGFTTCDSGDGRSKLEGDDPMGCAVSFPHVAILSDPDSLVEDCDKLEALLLERGVMVAPMGPEEGVSIEGTYDPALRGPGQAVIVLSGLDDEGLAQSMLRGQPPQAATD